MTKDETIEPSLAESRSRFGHHPDPATDFCVEVDDIAAEIVNLDVFEAGPAAWHEMSDRIDRAMDFRVGGDESAVAAKDKLREISDQFEKSLRVEPTGGVTSPDYVMVPRVVAEMGVKAIQDMNSDDYISHELDAAARKATLSMSRQKEKPFWMGEFGVSKQALHDIDGLIGGKYELGDGRAFWIDGATVREIMRRITPVIGAEIERHRLMMERSMLSAAPPSPRSDDGSGLTPHSTAVSAIAQERDVGKIEWRDLKREIGNMKNELNGMALVGAKPLWGSLVGRLEDLCERLSPTTSPKAIGEEPSSSEAVREALMQARASFQAIQRATIEGRVCDDVAWFSEITTLHDYCAGQIEIIDKSIEMRGRQHER
jgi:GGDEF domain-containing protein